MTASGGGDSDLMEMTLDDRRQVRPLVQTSFSEGGGVLSPDARYVTGTCILVDGGMLLPPITEI